MREKYLKLYEKELYKTHYKHEAPTARDCSTASHVSDEEEGWMMLVTVWWMKSRNGFKRLVNKLQNVMFSKTRMDCM